MSERKQYFCNEPWDGIFSIETNLDVTFCPCFLKMHIGNLGQNTLLEIWNSEKLQQLRESFSKGELPAVCEKQLCPVALSQVPLNAAATETDPHISEHLD